MNYLISVQDLLLGLLYVVAFAVGVLLLFALLRLIKIFKRVDTFLAENEKHLSMVAQELPETLHSIKEGVDSVKQTVDSASTALGLVETEDRDSVAYHIESISRVIALSKELIQFVVGFFSKR